MIIRTRFVWALLPILWAVRPALAGPHPLGLNENQPYGRLTSGYATPHVAWAKPYARGPVNVWVLAPEWSQRETVELAQRLDIAYTPWMPLHFDNVSEEASDPAFSFFIPSATVAHDVLVKGLAQAHDAVIVGKLDWMVLPAKQRFALLEKVYHGMGLVYVNPPTTNQELAIVFGGAADPAGAAFITGNLPLAALPHLRDIPPNELVKTVTFGQGRVVVLNYREDVSLLKTADAAWPCLTPQWPTNDPVRAWSPLETLPPQEWVAYEYDQALVARAVLWAARKEPTTRLGPIHLPATVAWGQPAVATATISGAPPDVRVRATVRHASEPGRVTTLKDQPATAPIRVLLPTLPAGTYVLDLWVVAAHGPTVHTWGSAPFTVTTDFAFGAPTLDKSQYEPGDAVTATVTMPRPLAPGETLLASLWDNRGRKVTVTPVTVAAATATARFPGWIPVTILHRVSFELQRDGRTVTLAEKDFPVRARLRHDDFNEVVWTGAVNSPITLQMLRKLADEDQTDAIDIGWSGATAARNIAAANLQALPYRDRFGPVGGNAEHVVAAVAGNAYGCMRHPLTLAALDKRMAEHALIYASYGTFAYTHGDETLYSADPDVCWCPTCLQALRTELAQSYPDLAALNADWGTTYAKWDEVLPLTYQQAKQTGAYARWIEHRRSSNRTLAQFYQRSQQALRNAGDSGARAGFDGAGGDQLPNSGFDWWTLTQSLDLIQAYGNDEHVMNIFRSFLRPGQLSGVWYGTYGLTWEAGPNTVPFCQGFPWDLVFHGLNSTWFWTMGAPGPLSGYAPDLTSLPFFAARTASLREIKGGIGKLLLAGTRQHDGILIHFSEASRLADSFFADKEADWSSGWVAAVTSLNLALDDCGLSYNYIATAQIENGDLARSRARILILPHSRAISAKEAAEIGRFVAGGGVLLADILPGTLNGHGTPQKTGMLAALFPTNTTNVVTTVGQGKTLLWGNLLDGYGTARMSQYGWMALNRRWTKLGDLLQREAGLTPPVAITAASDQPLPPTGISRFRCGAIEFVGLLRNYFLYDNDPHAARVRFPAKAHLYDVRAGRYLGRTDSLDTTISSEARLFALAPYQVTAVRLRLPGTGKAGQAMAGTITVQVSGGKPSTHAFRIEVTDAQGKPLPWYAQNVLAADGTAAFTIPWAVSDGPGRYTVTGRDVMSGVTARHPIQVR